MPDVHAARADLFELLLRPLQLGLLRFQVFLVLAAVACGGRRVIDELAVLFHRPHMLRLFGQQFPLPEVERIPYMAPDDRIDLSPDPLLFGMVRYREVLPDQRSERPAGLGIGRRTEQQAVRFGLHGESAQVDPLETFEQRVALHDLVVEVRERLRLLLVHHQRQPEAQAGDIDSTLFDIDAVDVLLDDFALDLRRREGLPPLRKAVQHPAALEDFAQHPHRESARADRRIAHLDLTEQRVEPRRDLGVLQRRIDLARADQPADSGVNRFVGMRPQILDQALAAHVLHDLLRGVERPLVLVVFEQILEDVPQHFGIDAHLAVVGVVFVDREVVLGEKLDQLVEISIREVDPVPVQSIAVEQTAVQIRNADAVAQQRIGQIVLPLAVERLEKQQFEHLGEQPVVALMTVEQRAHVVCIAARPPSGFGRDTHPALLLEELQEDEPSQQLLDIIPLPLLPPADIRAEFPELGLVAVEKVGIQFLDRECLVYVFGRNPFVPEQQKPIDGRAVRLVGIAEQIGKTLGSRLPVAQIADVRQPPLTVVVIDHQRGLDIVGRIAFDQRAQTDTIQPDAVSPDLELIQTDIEPRQTELSEFVTRNFLVVLRGQHARLPAHFRRTEKIDQHPLPFLRIIGLPEQLSQFAPRFLLLHRSVSFYSKYSANTTHDLGSLPAPDLFSLL